MSWFKCCCFHNQASVLMVWLLCAACIITSAPVAADAARSFGGALDAGIALRDKGDISLSIQTLTDAGQLATTPEEKAQAAGELSASLFQARRYVEAESVLTPVYNSASGAGRARYALEKGNIALARKQPEAASIYYKEAQVLAPDDAVVTTGAALNLARMAPEAQRLALLSAIAPQLAAIPQPVMRARYMLNLGNQAHALGAAGLQLAYTQYSAARALLQPQAASRLQVEALDSLAQLYEEQGRLKEAATLNQQALQMANTLEASSVSDVLVALYWRQGRLQALEHKPADALVSYQHAVDIIETIRMDIPLEYDDGTSSYKALLEPVYIGLADLLLKNAAGQSTEQQQPLLQRVSKTTELLKQTEMQDFLGDRCAIEEIKGDNTADAIAKDTAVFYPLVFEDRTELLVMHDGAITRYTVPVKKEVLRNEIARYDEQMRYQEAGYLPRARQLYQWLVAPAVDALLQHGVKNLIIVPDSSLRIVPFASLYDGKQFLVEKFAIASVAGLSMTTVGSEGIIDQHGMDKSLVVGMSSPGPVAEKLANMEKADSPGTDTEKEAFYALRLNALKQELELPSVATEVNQMSSVLKGASLKDKNFTLDSFTQKVETENYQILHIASHGVFGGTEETSYIMAYDDIIRMNDLQRILDVGRGKKQHIRLLTLSACQTAEGSEAAPIGISGAAIKARARSVLGTLWPVDDTGAQTFMKNFYTGVAEKSLSKVAAVQQSQIAMIHSADMQHPFYWAPFTLIGNWQ